MSDRHTVNTINSDALDQLYNQLDALREAAHWTRRNYPGLTSVNERLTAALGQPEPGPAATEATGRPNQLAEAFRDCLDSFTAVLDTHGLHTTHHHARALPHEMRKWQTALNNTEQP